MNHDSKARAVIRCTDKPIEMSERSRRGVEMKERSRRGVEKLYLRALLGTLEDQFSQKKKQFADDGDAMWATGYPEPEPQPTEPADEDSTAKVASNDVDCLLEEFKDLLADCEQKAVRHELFGQVMARKDYDEATKRFRGRKERKLRAGLEELNFTKHDIISLSKHFLLSELLAEEKKTTDSSQHIDGARYRGQMRLRNSVGKSRIKR
ncbi:hypothetical protein QBC38DRAFT_445197 [Podospora fimiseda]|uniref:Uncharacterized protein n=1 Tax=Podospora fimiseda TaxID=252190 RepID=A0AAN7GZK9_9PEZI|nr:hypothetical protein QBC38DRAFT_445197 [Podospora fimiseda]